MKATTGMQCPTYHSTGILCAGCEKCTLSAAARDVLAERQRQINNEGFQDMRDDKYIDCELARAAATYTLCTDPGQLKVCDAPVWPWPLHWWKPTTYRHNLVKAAALLLAEIERIDRAAQPADAGESGNA